MVYRVPEVVCIFQSTLPRGERLEDWEQETDSYYISIHAPARGATNSTLFFASLFVYFNPRSREGSDGVTYVFRRDRHYFNPRSREGSDSPACLPALRRSRFQSTLPRGERPTTSLSQNRDFSISIHAPARGATRTGLPSDPTLIYFNPRSREGSDKIVPLTLRRK